MPPKLCQKARVIARLRKDCLSGKITSGTCERTIGQVLHASSWGQINSATDGVLAPVGRRKAA